VQAGNVVTLVGGTLSAVAILLLGWWVRPALVLGADGIWLFDVIKSRGPVDDPALVEVPA